MTSKLSRAYLEESLTAAKRLLPGWQYATIRQAAIPRAGARARHSPEKRPPSAVQSLIFDKANFTAEQARAWANEHGYESTGVDETETSYRFRQEEPGDFAAMRTISLTDGVKAVIGIKGAAAEKEAIAKGDEPKGAIVAAWVPLDLANALAMRGGEPAERLHVTLAYLEGFDPALHPAALAALADALRDQAPISARVSGIGRFEQPGGTHVYHATIDAPGLAELAARVAEALRGAGFAISAEHGFDPHATLAYAPAAIEPGSLPQNGGAAWTIDAATLAIGPVRLAVPFGYAVPDPDLAAGWAHEAAAMASEAAEALPAGDAVANTLRMIQAAAGRAADAALGARDALADAENRAWDEAYLNELPDGAFLHVAPGGERDEGGRTTPRTLRHFAVRDAAGVPVLPRLRNALARIPQSLLDDGAKAEATRTARALLGSARKGAWRGPVEAAALASAEGAVPTRGPVGAPILFVGTATTKLDAARREPLAGPVGATFREEVLAPLGLRPESVAVTNLVPVVQAGEPDAFDLAVWRAWIDGEIRRVRPALVVALGKAARETLGERADFALPHPSALRKGDTRGEVARKVKAIRKALTEKAGTSTNSGTSGGVPIPGTADATSSRADSGADRAVRVAKADRAKQVVYGVVLDPYVVDTQNDWTPPAEIEQAAHRWLAESRTVGLIHEGKAKAVPVESYMVPYPSEEDYARAMRGEPHRAARMKLGEQEVASGAWVLGVRVDDADTWAKVDAGELDAFSIGGFSERTRTTRAAMPKVEFVR